MRRRATKLRERCPSLLLVGCSNARRRPPAAAATAATKTRPQSPPSSLPLLVGSLLAARRRRRSCTAGRRPARGNARACRRRSRRARFFGFYVCVRPRSAPPARPPACLFFSALVDSSAATSTARCSVTIGQSSSLTIEQLDRRHHRWPRQSL